MNTVLILGNNGMLGHAVENILKNDKQINLFTTSRTGTEATKAFDVMCDDLENLISQLNPDYIVNCIGAIKPRIDEKSMQSIADAIEINSLFPHKLLNVANTSHIKVIQIATDCVYSGEKGSYTESANHDPRDVYGRTKSLGEIYASNFLNLRVSIIGPEQGRSTSLLEWFINQPQGARLKGYANHFWNGISTYQFAKITSGIISQDNFHPGSQHLVPANQVSKYELLKLFKNTYGRDDLEITEVFPETVVDRTLSTNNPGVNEYFWKSGGYPVIPTIQEVVSEMRFLSESLI